MISARRPTACCPLTGFVFVLALASAGCGVRPGPAHLGSHTDLEFLRGRVVSDRPVVAVTGPRWGGNTEGGKWVFKGSARIHCIVNRVPEENLVFYFTPDETTADMWFTASWDGRPLFEEPQMPAYGENAVGIPRELVTVGVHTLTVERADSLTPPDLRSKTINVFPRMAYGLGSTRWDFDLGRIHQYRYTAMLLSRGVTGASNLRMSGCLFDGPGRAEAELTTHVDGSMSFRVENGSEALAVFTLGLGEQSASVEVEPGGTGRLELGSPAGTRSLSLRVAGDEGGLFLWGAPRLDPAGLADRPPIVIVTLDTTRRDALSPWGAPPPASPNLQELADGAVVFDNAWAVSPWTLPSHASLFTGLYPHHHLAGVTEDHLPSSFSTIAEALSAAGYFSAGFAGGVMSAATFGVAQGFDLYRDPDGFESPGDVLVEAVRKMLDEAPQAPLHLFVNFFDPHGIYAAPPEYRSLFDVERLADPIRDLPVWTGLVQGRGQAFGRLINGEAELSPEALSYLSAAYLAEVAFMDAQIGHLFELLGERGLLDPALVVVVADHGELLGEHGLFGHCCRLDPELMEVPLIVKWPHQRHPMRVGELVSQVDLFGTILAAAGVDAPPGDGLPIDPGDLSTLRTRHDVFMEEHDESRIHPLYEHMMLARHVYGLQRPSRREVVWDGGMTCQQEDGGPWRDVSCEGHWAERLIEIRDRVALPIHRSVTGYGEIVTDDDRERLRALGYMQ